MRAIIQRVLHTEIVVNKQSIAKIPQGLLIFLGIGHEDTKEDLEWLAQKIIQLRLFSDEDGKMNLSIEDIKGHLCIVSQFTLFAKTKKGNRPSFMGSAEPVFAHKMYEDFLCYIRQRIDPERVKTGQFGADMKISLENDGPVTLIIDTKNKE